MSEQATEATTKRSSPAKMTLRVAVSLVLIAVIFWYLLKDISLADVWAAITAMTWGELAGLAVIAGWNLCTYAFVWMTVTPGLSFGRAMVMTQATTAITNTVPAGSAIGIGMTYAMLHSWGCSSPASGTPSPSWPSRCSRSPWSPSRATPAPPGSPPPGSASAA
jgi:uncharacterized membrane protein YbhN (UPF0104 family)